MVDHSHFMNVALDLAREAWRDGDWPVAAVLVRDGAILGRGRGRQRTLADPTRHAETDAIGAARAAGADPAGATVYCTMEPCPMCAWALHLVGVRRIVLGARHADLGRTDLGGYSIEAFAALMGHEVDLVTGVLRDECVALRRRWGQDR